MRALHFKNLKKRYCSCRTLSCWIAVLLAVAPLRVYAGVNCSASTSSVSFGTYNPFDSSPTDATGNVQVTCSGQLGLLAGYTILLSRGGSGSYAPRKMASGANRLDYNLYTNASRSMVWGDGTSGTSVVSDSSVLHNGKITRDYPVYGRTPAGQNASVGSYSDTVIVTVNY
jgi:spore coat protein U-like protein